jgi:hypothetical protein
VEKVLASAVYTYYFSKASYLGNQVQVHYIGGSTTESVMFVSATSHMDGRKIILNQDSKEMNSPNALCLSDCNLNHKKCLADFMQFWVDSNIIERIKGSIEIILAEEFESFGLISFGPSSSSFEYLGKSISAGDFNGVCICEFFDFEIHSGQTEVTSFNFGQWSSNFRKI